MFNGFMQAFKEIGAGGPPIQDGRVIQDPKTFGTEKPVEFDEDGELTEEGFVSIGQSSFIYSMQKYPEQDSVPPNLSALYPYLPKSGSAQSFNGQPKSGPSPSLSNGRVIKAQPQNNLSRIASIQYQNTSVDMDNRNESELLRGLPFVLHPTLRNYDSNSGANQKRLSIYENLRNPIGDLSAFSYDFEFERSVLRAIQQQF